MSRTEKNQMEVIQAEVEEVIEHPPAEGLINHLKEEHAVNEPEPSVSSRFQTLATVLIVCCALVGTMLGAILSNEKVDKEIISWLALPGDLFIRALKCIVLPLVFVNVILAVMQMSEAGKAGTVGKVTVGVYLLTTLVAALEGLVFAAIFSNFFSEEEGEPKETFVRFFCPAGENLVLTQDGEDVSCQNVNLTAPDATHFTIDNVNGFFVTNSDEIDAPSFSQTLQDNIFKQLVPENIVQEFANAGFVGVVMFGILFGAASQGLNRKPVLLLEFLEDVNDILVNVIEWIILLTPFAVVSLIAGALGSQDDLQSSFSDLGVLVATVIVADIIHIFVTYPLMFYYFVRKSPFPYMRYLLPAQFFAFACASSAATLPVTMRCVQTSGMVPDSIKDFVLPIGATINMDGAALYFPAALIFLATAQGIESDFTHYFMILIVSTIGSAGAAPVPNAGLVLLLTAYGTVYEGPTPEAFGLLFGVDWLVDRMQTVMNITGDAMVARIVTHLTGLDTKPNVPISMLSLEEDEVETKKVATL